MTGTVLNHGDINGGTKQAGFLPTVECCGMRRTWSSNNCAHFTNVITTMMGKNQIWETETIKYRYYI